MSKHKRRKTNEGRNDNLAEPNYQGGNMNNLGGSMGNLAGILGNIDINQITSLLNASGILGNTGSALSQEDKIKDVGREAKEGILNNLDITQLLSQANELNSIIYKNNNVNNDLDFEEDDSKHKTRQNNSMENNNVNNQQSGDSIVALLNVIKSLVTPDKAEIIDSIVGLYIQGKL